MEYVRYTIIEDALMYEGTEVNVPYTYQLFIVDDVGKQYRAKLRTICCTKIIIQA